MRQRDPTFAARHATHLRADPALAGPIGHDPIGQADALMPLAWHASSGRQGEQAAELLHAATVLARQAGDACRASVAALWIDLVNIFRAP